MKLAKKEIRTAGMHCSGCAERVADVLNNLKGIRSADISFMDSTGLHIPDETARHFWREEETGRYQQDRIHRKAKECQRKLNSHE